MTNYLFKNLNTLFLTCALAFISIANAQEVRVIDNKGTIDTILKQTIAELFDTGGGLTITDADAIIQFNTQGIIDSNDYSTTLDDDSKYTSITIKKNGTYKVTYRVTAQITSGESRSGTEYRLLKTDEDGDISVVPGSYSAAYHRIVNRGKNTASASRILVLEKDDKLTVRGNRYAGNSTVKTVAHGSSFLVERMIK